VTIVPVIDVADPDLEALARACGDHGFFLLSGHGLDETIANSWRTARQFMDSPDSTKNSVRRDADNPLGYNDRELTKQSRDHKEVFDFIDPSNNHPVDPNRWPPDLPGFRDALEEHFASVGAMAIRTLDLVWDALGADQATRRSYPGEPSASAVRLNRYATGDPVPEDERAGLAPLGDVALGHHTDVGVLTLLLQEDIGGLQALSTDDGWIDVPPDQDTIVVNMGDTMQVWSNDRFRAAVHRVTPMTNSERYSIAYFLNPRRDAMLEPIDGLSGEPPRYRRFTWREYMQGRNDDNFADAGDDDVQISRYLLTEA